MSELAIGGGGGSAAGAFRPATIALVVAIGILAFVAMLVLGAYAPDLRSGRNGGAHALSNAATGYSGLVRLAEATGRNPMVLRFDMSDSEDLLVLTPETGTADMTSILAERHNLPTLIVLPKWRTVAHPARTGWVRSAGLVPRVDPEHTLAPAQKLHVGRLTRPPTELRIARSEAPPAMRVTAPGTLQLVGGPGLRPILVDSTGRGVLVQVGEGPLYVLSDPDLINNKGMADRRQAAAALAMLDFLNSTEPGGILFDVTLNGLGQGRSPLRLAFDPPFLAATLAIAVALLLAGLQAIARFGAPRRPERAIAFGKAALVDNAAALVRRARREAALGRRYAETIRERAVTVFGVPARLRDGAVNDYLDRLDGRTSFSALAAAADAAQRREELLAAAQALHRWQWEKKG